MGEHANGSRDRTLEALTLVTVGLEEKQADRAAREKLASSSEGGASLVRAHGSVVGVDEVFFASTCYRVEHLTRVASSLESGIVGEPQVRGQVRESFGRAPSAATRRSSGASTPWPAPSSPRCFTSPACGCGGPVPTANRETS